MSSVKKNGKMGRCEMDDGEEEKRREKEGRILCRAHVTKKKRVEIR